MLPILLLIAGIAVVMVGANLLVEGASSIAKKFQVSDLVIGLTVVALGTSTPELTVSIYSALNGESDLALGNVVGSNIFNVLVIAGIAALIYPINVQSNTVWKEIPFSFLAALVVLVMAADHFLDGSSVSVISRSDGLVLLGFFLIFLYYTFLSAKQGQPDELNNTVKTYSIGMSVLLILGGLVLLVIGGRLLVDNAVKIAEWLGMSKSVIGLTIVAAGTSVPELATSAVAAYKKNSDIAIGNVVGSNIFNSFLILGTSATVTPLGLGNITMTDLIICAGVSLFLFIHSYDLRISRIEGAVLLAGYIGYVIYLL